MPYKQYPPDVLAQLAGTPAGQARYRGISVPTRIRLLQDAASNTQGGLNNLSGRDQLLLQLLRRRREQESHYMNPNATDSAFNDEGFLERFLGARSFLQPLKTPGYQ